ncbi:branched-chain amino acid ABC transporter permease [Pseudonocardia sp. GCM10023141]|uniref:branched-chain amino acid ABC transporter permease n=1 Tax=Pseudonocardia sp. GCM10023141 TaxID=3252653 RepID=UPI00360CF68C
MRRLRWIAAVAAVVVLALLPLSASPFLNLQIALVAAYAVAIRGLDVITGHAGQASLGQAAFFGLGGYIAAYGFANGWPVVLGLVLAIGGTGLVGALIALPAVRTRGFAFGTITLALPVIAVPLAVRLKDVTGGSEGRTVEALPAPEWSGLADDQWRYYVVLVIAAVAFLLVHNLLRGRVGRGLDLLRTNEIVATAMGVPVTRYKVLAFTVSALCGGLGGWLCLVAVQFISPETLHLNLTILMLVAAVVGGLRSSLGSVIGAAFYVVVPSVTDQVAPGRSYLVFGIALLVVLVFFPKGIHGGLVWILARFPARAPHVQEPTGAGGPRATAAPSPAREGELVGHHPHPNPQRTP